VITVVTVLRTGGGTYTAEWVNRLHAGVQRHLPVDHDFVCLTDDPRGMDRGVCVEPLRHDWPGWWAKQELFTPGLFDDLVIYFDLDTVITGDLVPFTGYTGPRAFLRDFFRYRENMIGSGMMLWMGDEMADIYREFTKDPEAHMRTFRRRSDEFTKRFMGRGHFIQDLWPGLVVSSKAHCRTGLPENARVVCMHGRPRMTELEPTHWLRQRWEAVA